MVRPLVRETQRVVELSALTTNFGSISGSYSSKVNPYHLIFREKSDIFEGSMRVLTLFDYNIFHRCHLDLKIILYSLACKGQERFTY